MKNILDAVSPEDKALTSSILKIEKWSGMDITYERVNAGFTNFNYLIHIDKIDLTCFAKVVGPGSEAFIDREVAHEAAVAAHNSGVGPAILAYVKEDNFEVYEYLLGYKCFTISDMINPELAAKVMSCYSKIHCSLPLSKSNSWSDQITELHQKIITENADISPDLKYLMWQFKRAKKAIEPHGNNLVPCYNDGYVTNYMKNEKNEVRIIDWEYGANNDPYWDIATYFFESFADAKTREKLLKHYNSSSGELESARVDVFIPLICLKWGLWASLQSSISKIEFDYLKYADILFMRAKHLIDQEPWEKALSNFY
ncbi:MAG: phosphotransferase [Paracoccaceae bacterium]|nr:phosphotransferase [Paracoccaceae bacterium]